MPRLFISHSSVDNIAALAFLRWLIANGWDQEDVFIDLHGIGAGERWRDTLRKAGVSCEAVILLASPDSLDSKECQREINLAEDLGKPILVVILRDLTNDDTRLARFADTQFVNLSAEPLERMEPFEHEGKVQRVSFNLAALLSIKRSLEARGIAPGSFAWQPHKLPDGTLAGPYPGLAAFSEDDAGIFFGREAEIASGLAKLRQMGRRRSPRILVIQAASGAGKSSYLRAGLWPRLTRDPDYAPLAVLRPALGVLTGPDGFGRRFAPWLERHGRKMAPADIHARLFQGGDGALTDLIADAAAMATSVRRAGMPDARPPAPIIAIDQGEELFAPENAAESDRFLAMLVPLLKAPPTDVDPYVLLTIRADSVEALWQRLPALGLDAPETLPLLPLAPDAYRDIILKPASVYSSRVRPISVEPELVAALARNTSGADALPLLAFTLERLFGEAGTDGKLTLARYEGMGGLEGSIDRALAEARRKAGAAGSEQALHALFIPQLATWDPAANAAKRLVAPEAELIAADRAPLAPLATALVDGRLLTRGRDTIEVAHEALLRRPPIAGWLDEHKDALKLRDDVLREAKEWSDRGKYSADLVRRGERLGNAERIASNPIFKGALAPASNYLAACRKDENATARAAGRRRAAIYTLMLGVITALTGVIYKEPLGELWFEQTTVRSFMATDVRPHVLSAEREQALKPGESFRECAQHCPEMVAVPAGSFRMGSPDTEAGRYNNEGPVRSVTIARPFAVAKFEVTWDEWEACVAMRGCDGRPTGDAALGKGRKPVINVTWDQARSYAQWLSRMTGKDYRLLSEAEWEYAARAGTQTAYSFGSDAIDICRQANLADQSFRRGGYTGDIADCNDGQTTTAPVGSYPANAFGLHDMHGNVWEWVQDCYDERAYATAPTDGTAIPEPSDCKSRVVRGGSWSFTPRFLRAAIRLRNGPDDRDLNLGFRVARALPPARTN
ncbi:MAG: SUMF1/EgtB/PvdO family nonheme iron enzyme [Hyphomicrobiaceae bacterium]|nr:SUMF1/EgtB/PvdO family nonheme iron enzyme [Hyphomicrobiaceae bacterium]